MFRNRIELRQIGARDEAKMLGGIGICGRPYCCSQFLDDFQPVSTKMAKAQSMSLNPSKISGACGRLMCCLRYEQAAYEELVKAVPKVGAFVATPAGYGTVSSVNILRSSLKVKLDGQGEDVFKNYQADELAVLPGGSPKPGEPRLSLLTDRSVHPRQNPARRKNARAAAHAATAGRSPRTLRLRRRRRRRGQSPRVSRGRSLSPTANPARASRGTSQRARTPSAAAPRRSRPSRPRARRRTAKNAPTAIAAAIAAGAAATSPRRPAMQRPARRRRNKSQNRCIPIRYAPVFCAVWFRSAVRRPRRTPVRSRSGRARLPAARSHRPHLLPCPCGTGRCCRPAPPCPRG